MVATLNQTVVAHPVAQSVAQSVAQNTANPNPLVEKRFDASFLTVSRLGDLRDDIHDDFTIEALRRAAAIRKTWSAQEIAQRQQVGQQRRDQLSKMLSAASGQ